VETVKVTVPVYPFLGVIVTVELPELPLVTVRFVAERVKLPEVPPTVKVNDPVEAAKVESPE